MIEKNGTGITDLLQGVCATCPGLRVGVFFQTKRVGLETLLWPSLPPAGSARSL